MKKVLVLGGTGAMGQYLVPKLIQMRYKVDVVAFDQPVSNHPNLRYIQSNNAKEIFYQAELLKEDYDGIVDFLIYNTEEFRQRYEQFLTHTDHYIYLSSYRIYADSIDSPITETSPRLLDVSEDKEFLASEDYSLYKARGEDILEQSEFNNWTIIRPAITFSNLRFQLVTLEAPVTVYRALNNKAVVLPEEAMDVECTMSWAGDVAEMIARLLLNPQAKRERYTVATAEHQPWETVFEYYQKLIGMKRVLTDTETYVRLLIPRVENYLGCKWQLIYDRLFQRRIDNSKILNITGMKQSELMSLYDGLKLELSHLPKILPWKGEDHINLNMDQFLNKQ
ncbi:MAG: epimerase [Ruminococcaceae bacterium]|nr:epimerase [Oscillospiraceae bacterium]